MKKRIINFWATLTLVIVFQSCGEQEITPINDDQVIIESSSGSYETIDLTEWDEKLIEIYGTSDFSSSEKVDLLIDNLLQESISSFNSENGRDDNPAVERAAIACVTYNAIAYVQRNEGSAQDRVSSRIKIQREAGFSSEVIAKARVESCAGPTQGQVLSSDEESAANFNCGGTDSIARATATWTASSQTAFTDARLYCD